MDVIGAVVDGCCVVTYPVDVIAVLVVLVVVCSGVDLSVVVETPPGLVVSGAVLIVDTPVGDTGTMRPEQPRINRSETYPS